LSSAISRRLGDEPEDAREGHRGGVLVHPPPLAGEPEVDGDRGPEGDLQEDRHLRQALQGLLLPGPQGDVQAPRIERDDGDHQQLRAPAEADGEVVEAVRGPLRPLAEPADDQLAQAQQRQKDGGGDPEGDQHG
jgi:hypothetical protein